MLGQFLGSGSGITKLLYRFNGNVNDFSGNGLTGTLFGSPTYSPSYGRWSNGLRLDGVTVQSVDLPSEISNANFQTLSIWEYVLPGKSVWWGDTGTNHYLNIDSVFSGWYGGSATSVPLLTPGMWQHAVIVKTSTSTFACYVNGQFKGNVSIQFFPGILTTHLGRTTDGLKSGCYLGEVAVENQAWTDSKIRKNHTYSTGRFAVL